MRKVNTQREYLRSESREQGSDFHLMTYEKPAFNTPPWKNECIYGGSGRDLFRLLLNHGMKTFGWRRLWIPVYFCNDVTRAILESGIHIAFYPSGPEDTGNPLITIDFLPHDVLLVVNFFGIFNKINYTNDQRQKIVIIEDHTHDPWSEWSYKSDADWCIVSLRKVLPLPDGGVLWSPLYHQLPAKISVTNKRRNASLKKFAGMTLKAFYVNGFDVDKKIFRKLLTSGEEDIAAGKISGMSDWAKNILPTFPIDCWRGKRRNNYLIICNILSDLPWLSFVGKITERCCPFSAVVKFDTTERRNFVLQELIRSRIYPAILWRLEKAHMSNTPERYIDLSQRILSIHCDMRYNEQDMINVGMKIRNFGNVEYIDAKL